MGLDPNDFPALGSGSMGANAGVAGAANRPVTTLASSYASKLGQAERLLLKSARRGRQRMPMDLEILLQMISLR